MVDATRERLDASESILDPSTAQQWPSSGPVARLASAIASDPSASTEPADPLEYARYAVRWRLVSANCLSRVRSVRYLAECRRRTLDANA